MQFNGLSIIFNKMSRMDIINKRLCSAPAGDWFIRELKKHGIDYHQCFVKTIFDKTKTLPPDTIVLFLLGQEALTEYKQDISLGEQRGSPFIYCDTPCICSYAPQDAFDLRNYEERNSNEEQETKEESAESIEAIKSHGKTKRSNYKFWLTKDIQKVARILHENGKLNTINPTLEIMPSEDEIIYELKTKRGGYLSTDIETDPQTNDITVFSFKWRNTLFDTIFPTTYVVPCRRYTYTRCYDNLPRIFMFYSYAMCNNTVITHNGSGFDLFFLFWRYHIPIGKNHFDTMVSHHRLYPEVEKSLGHIISLYTDQEYHKNTSGTFAPCNTKQEMELWTYNGIDTHTTDLCAMEINQQAILKRAAESINLANRMVAAYLDMTFIGIPTSKKEIDELIKDNDRRINVYLRILEILTGKKGFNPNSIVHTRKYFFDKTEGLGLTPVSYSDKTNLPNCDAPSIIRMYLKYPEVKTFPVIIQIRRLQKECQALMFKPIDW